MRGSGDGSPDGASRRRCVIRDLPGAARPMGSGPGRREPALAAKISGTHICVVQALRAARETGPTPWVDPRMSLNQGGHAMRTFDLAPLYRSTVGFDRLF